MRWSLIAFPAAAPHGCVTPQMPSPDDPAALAAAPPQTLRARCTEGDGPSCTELGIRIERGQLRASESAASFYEKGCDFGDASGCNDLGWLLHNGKGVPVDVGRAAQFYARGCNRGSARACTNLGNLYEDGLGVPQDPLEALELYRRACDAGFGVGCRNAGLLYENGSGGLTPEDATSARVDYGRGVFPCNSTTRLAS